MTSSTFLQRALPLLLIWVAAPLPLWIMLTMVFFFR